MLRLIKYCAVPLSVPITCRGSAHHIPWQGSLHAVAVPLHAVAVQLHAVAVPLHAVAVPISCRGSAHYMQ